MQPRALRRRLLSPPDRARKVIASAVAVTHHREALSFGILVLILSTDVRLIPANQSQSVSYDRGFQSYCSTSFCSSSLFLCGDLFAFLRVQDSFNIASPSSNATYQIDQASHPSP